MTATLDAVQVLAVGMGWPLLLCRPGSKEPMTRHGVKDATADERTLLHLLDRHPEANLAVACGTPGPQVLDVDDPAQAKPVVDALRTIHPPTVATTRGLHHYFEGTEAGTIALPYGELRGRGSYVLVPPSIHPSGKQYVWLEGPRKLMPVLPAEIVGERRSAGRGEYEAPTLVPYGKRHDSLKDEAVRLLRGGYTDVPTLEQMLRLIYETRYEQTPPAKPTEFREIAVWASKTDIARRERLTEDNSPMPAKKPKRRRKGKTGLEDPPGADAALADHRGYVKVALGLPENVDVKNVKRHGLRGADPLIIELTNGQRVVFDQQNMVTTRGKWAGIVTICTSGIADPVGLSEWEALKVLRSLCILADTPVARTEAEDLAEAIDNFLAVAEPLTDHDLGDADGRYNLVAACRARPAFDPRRNEHEPVVIVDKDGRRYLRAGELRDYLNYHGLGIPPGALAGRMSMVGAEHLHLEGRESQRLDDRPRRKGHMQVYRLPEDW